MDLVGSQTEGILVKDELGEKAQKAFHNFLVEWKAEGSDELKYLEGTTELLKTDRNTLQVSLKDIERHNSYLADSIATNFYRLYPFLCLAVKNFLKDRVDKQVDKQVYVSLTEHNQLTKIRDLDAGTISQLTTITGQVVRTHPVHPELVSGTFQCLDCQTEISGVEQQFKYTQPSTCRNPVCNNRTRFLLLNHRSKFVDFQKVRIQEVQSELPRGCIPRSVEVILRAEAVETAQAGDRCDFTGCLIVVPDIAALNLPGAAAVNSSRGGSDFNQQNEGVSGLKTLGVRDLQYRTAFLACGVTSAGKNRLGGEKDYMETVEDLKKSMTNEEWEAVYKMSVDKNLYQNLIQSLFPTIHGHDEVKRGIMLMLFGGVPKNTLDSTSLRGDLNVCVVGDPSTAKSQFLKMVADFSPRAVYTSGKASSAAGLTAAVVRDEESGEFVIEAGALMLADNGVCCIDEFDKMEQHDQVAIHEAMEQQTITITKAGVKATLNARASILAAANPINGKYDRSKSLKQNIQMTAPIMSRFDLFFILSDECNDVTDYAIAKKILDLHTSMNAPIERVYKESDISKYIKFARVFQPKISIESSDLIVQQYRNLRNRENGNARTSWRITVRQLESMIRLSEACARMHCKEEVAPKHVREAYRLLNKSIIRVEQPDVALEEEDATAVEDVDQDQAGGAEEEEGGEAAKAKKSITYEDYRKMAFLLTKYIKQREERSESEFSDSAATRSQVVEWYLEEISGDIESQEELLEKKMIVERVLDRLIYNDLIIIPLNNRTLKGKGDEVEEDPFLVIHPNYDLYEA